MIRMAYLDEPELNKRILDAYVALMDTKTLRRHWREVRAAIPELKGGAFFHETFDFSPFRFAGGDGQVLRSGIVRVERRKEESHR